MTRKRVQSRRRSGIAMLLVLGIVAVASVLGWAMLAATSVRAKVETTTADALEASYQADSGVSYALYYIRNSDLTQGNMAYTVTKSDGKKEKKNKLDADDLTTPYTATTTGVTMWTGARGPTDITYTTAGDGLFSIRSTATIAGLTRTTLADAAYTYDRYTVTHAAAFNGNFAVPLKMKISGPVVAKGYVSDPWGNVSNSPAVTPAGANVTPIVDELSIVASTSASQGSSNNDRPYVFDGVTYWAEVVPNTVNTSLTSAHPATNPKNVFFTQSDLTINNLTLNGTLIVQSDKTLTVTGLCSITAKPEMPALIVGGQMNLKSGSTASRLTVAGVAWVGKDITDSANIPSSSGYLKVTGALLMGGSSPSVAGRYAGTITVAYDSAVSKIVGLSTVKKLNGVAVRGWRTESN